MLENISLKKLRGIIFTYKNKNINKNKEFDVFKYKFKFKYLKHINIDEIKIKTNLSKKDTKLKFKDFLMLKKDEIYIKNFMDNNIIIINKIPENENQKILKMFKIFNVNYNLDKKNIKFLSKLYELLYKIPKYKIQFNRDYDEEGEYDDDEEQDLINSKISYNTKMYKYIFSKIEEYLYFDIYLNNSKSIPKEPDELIFLRNLEEAKYNLVENLKKKTNNKYVNLNDVFNDINSYEDNLLNFINHETYKKDIFLNISIKNVIGIPEIKNIKDNFDNNNKFEDLINILKNKEEKNFFDFDIFINSIDFIMLKDDKNLDIKFYKKIENNEIIDISSYKKDITIYFNYYNIIYNDNDITNFKKDIILTFFQIIKFLKYININNIIDYHYNSISYKINIFDTYMYNFLKTKIIEYLKKIIKEQKISKSDEFTFFQNIVYKNKKLKNNLKILNIKDLNISKIDNKYSYEYNLLLLYIDNINKDDIKTLFDVKDGNYSFRIVYGKKRNYNKMNMLNEILTTFIKKPYDIKTTSHNSNIYYLNNFEYNSIIDFLMLKGDDLDLSFYKEDKQLGGFKNIIELEEVFRLYYTSDEEITNIYKLYFIINIYGYYFQDNPEKYGLIENLLEIIKIDIFNEDIIETIKNLTTNIYQITKKIYENYIKTFDLTDKIIKNFCQTEQLIYKYLNMNFIYEFYKNYQKKDIKIQVNINGTILKINKSLNEIINEIDEIYINGEGLFPQSSYKISINSYDNEIDNFIHFIYDFTKNQSTIELTNLNDLNAFIVLQLLSNENEMINLKINEETFMIRNINNHPYKLHMTDNFEIKIRLNEVQYKLYKKLFEMENHKSLLGILAKDYYYLDFNIKKNSKFKFHLNYEILPFISHLNIDDNFKRTIINYNSFKPMMIDELDELKIIKLNNNSIIFLINYGILLSSTLFSQINIKNFISLIYIYFIIKNNTRDYLKLYNYNEENPLIIIYRDYIKSINFIKFLKSVLFMMKIKLNLKMDLKQFIKFVINFRENIFIKTPIKIDVNFLQNLYNTKSYNTDEKFIEDFYLSFLLIYKNCLKGKRDKNIIKMFNIFLIPCLRFFHNKINIKEIENEVLDIKALEYIRLINGIKGGDGEKPAIPTNIEKEKNEYKELKKKEINEDKVVLTTELSDNTKDILKLLEIFNNFFIEFSKLDLNDLLSIFQKNLDDLFLIYKDNENKDQEIYITSEDKISLFVDYKDKSKEERIKVIQKLISIRNNIINNMRNLTEIKEQFSYKLFKDNEKKDKLNDKSKNLARVLDYIEQINKSLVDQQNGVKKYQNKSREIDNIFVEFFPQDENQVPLMDKINEFVLYYRKKVDKFLDILDNNLAKYELLKKDINSHEEKANKYFDDEDKNQMSYNLERKEELKRKTKKNEEEKNKIEEDIKKTKKKIQEEQIKNQNKEGREKNISDELLKVLTDELSDLTEKKNKIESDNAKIDEENQLLKQPIKKGGKKPSEENQDIKKLLDKNDASFKDKDEKITFEDRKNDIKKRFDNIKKDYRKLKVSTYIPNSVNKDMIIEKFIDKKGDTLFEQILNNYSKDVKEKNLDIAKANFYESVDNNNLDPIKELEITLIDKLIFAFLIIFLRYAGLYLTYKFIDNKIVKSIKEAIIYYSLSYVACLFIFVVIVNIDLFRLRIIFNYCNLHINSTGILSHMIINIIIGYLIYLLIINIDNEPIPTYLSKNQNIKLKKKLDILSMIVLIFLLIFILII